MTKYLIVDTLNTFFRARHTAPKQADIWDKIGLAMQITMGIVNKSFRKERADHVVFCTEGQSWRKAVYAPYKRNRQRVKDEMNAREQEEEIEFLEAYKALIVYLQKKTNCTVLFNEIAEADDLIARWIDKHQNDQHVILSSDTDFIQLLAENVSIYNGLNNHLITIDGVFDDLKRPVKDKDSEPVVHDPKWALFEKCIRGDTSDNIFSAYPGVRKKSSKNKVGIIEAFEDMDNKGYAWNNFMLQRWADHEGEEHKVVDDYQRNVSLIDLTAQPAEVKEYIDETIEQQLEPSAVRSVGLHFLKFCGKYDLNKLSDFSDQYTVWLNAPYREGT